MSEELKKIARKIDAFFEDHAKILGTRDGKKKTQAEEPIAKHLRAAADGALKELDRIGESRNDFKKDGQQ